MSSVRAVRELKTTLDLLRRVESGRRDSNPRPSPWQGGGIRLGGPLPSGEVLFRPSSFHSVLSIRRCSRAVYYEPIPVVDYLWPQGVLNFTSGFFGTLHRPPFARCWKCLDMRDRTQSQ